MPPSRPALEGRGNSLIQKFRIIPNLKNKATLTIHPTAAKRLKVCQEERRFIQFGLKSQEVKLLISPEIKSQEILLSEGIIDILKIPLAPKFEIMAKDNQLVLGPYIGILAAKGNQRLDEIVTNLSNYVYHYNALGGAILAFSLDGVDTEQNIIRGYVFNPETKKWILGSYSYPAAIMQRIRINKYWRNHFQTTVGNFVFNNYIFDKWEMHQWLSHSSPVQNHLPETILYRKVQDIFFFLKEYHKAYLKPLSGSQGSGVIEATQKGSYILLRYRINGEEQEAYFDSPQEGKALLQKLLQKGKYIIQKAVDLITSEDRIIDFRLIILKNQWGEWEDFGMIGRYSKAKSIISNISGGGQAELGEKTLERVLNLKAEEVYTLRKQMSEVAIEAAKSVEAQGIHCGNLGVDLGLDKKGHIWIIEINNRDPNHTIAIDAGDKHMFYKIKLANMLYAKRLAGFAKEL